MDNLALTIFAAGTIGGVVFLIITIITSITHAIVWVDGWSGWRSASKVIRAVVADRRARGWERRQSVDEWRWAK